MAPPLHRGLAPTSERVSGIVLSGPRRCQYPSVERRRWGAAPGGRRAPPVDATLATSPWSLSESPQLTGRRENARIGVSNGCPVEGLPLGSARQAMSCERQEERGGDLMKLLQAIIMGLVFVIVWLLLNAFAGDGLSGASVLSAVIAGVIFVAIWFGLTYLWEKRKRRT